MDRRPHRFQSIAGALLVTVVFSLPGLGQDAAGRAPPGGPTVDELFAQLRQPAVDSTAVEGQIIDRWSRSGSASMDLLLQRGEEAMEAQDFEAAIGFYSALIDHAPQFAQGYSARGAAYYAAGMIGPALADIESALALEPRHFEALSGLAVILEEVATPGEALEAWRMVAELTPHDPAVKQAIERLESQGGRGQTL